MAVADPNDIEAFLTDATGSQEPPASVSVQSEVEGGEPRVSVDDSAGAMTRRLLVPLKVDGVDLREVSVRTASLGDIDDWGSGRLKTNRDLLARLTGLHPAVLQALKWADAEAVIKLFEAAVPAFVIDEMGRPE